MSLIKDETRSENQEKSANKDEFIQKCTIEHLATEILHIIFLYTVDAYTSWKVASQEMKREGHADASIIHILGPCPEIGGYAPPRNFPYNIAGVCNRWREILSICPSYWTQLNILVDSDEPTPLTQLKLYMEYSKNLSLRFSLKRRDGYSAQPRKPDLLREKHRVRGIIDILKPHLYRCTSIEFHVFYASVLPTFSHDLRAISSHLQFITLECDTDDNTDNYIADKANEATLEPIWPELKFILLTGHSILDALEHAPTLLKRIGGQVEFRNYRGDPKNEDYFLSHLLRVFSSADASRPKTLSFENVSVPIWCNPPGTRVSWNVRDLYIEDSIVLLLDIIKYVEFDRLFLLSINWEKDDAVELPADFPPFPTCHHLALRGITNDLQHLLSGWNGYLLELSECHEVDDKFIRYLADRKASGSCNRLLELRVFCLGGNEPSPKAIMELASTESPSYTDSHGIYYPGPNKMDTIEIQNWSMEGLSEEDSQMLDNDFADVISWSLTDGGGVGE